MNIIKFAKMALCFLFQRKIGKRNANNWNTSKKPHKAIPISSAKDWSGRDYLFDKPQSSRKTHLYKNGKVHNIGRIFKRLNQEQFDGVIKARITFGRHGCKTTTRRTSIKLGTYSRRERLIRIHPALDSPEVPEYFIEHVIYHEMLHQIYEPVLCGQNKWIIHTDEFYVAETCGPSYAGAMEWLHNNYSTVFFKKPNI